MCGIAGIFSYGLNSQAVDQIELVACRDYMHQRGPDGAGLWIGDDDRIGLAHRRLAIIDLDERALQPMHLDQRYAIIFNGEIYNYRDLRNELEETGTRFETTSDTEVILRLYAKHGSEMIRRLRGMFAFAIYDKSERRLFLARDTFGIKPLYYADDGQTFRFASQVRALIAAGGVDDRPSAAGWTGFFLFGSVPEPHTVFASIHSLPAGTTMTIDHRGAGKPRPFASIAGLIGDARQAPTNTTLTEARNWASAALLESVRYHLEADVPVGAFLSGGVDSGALVGLMRDAGQLDIETLTLSFNEFSGSSLDEAPLAAEVARTYGTHHHNYVITEAEFRDDLSKIMTAMDQPTIDGLNTWFVAKAAKDVGLKVVVSGLGGDEIFGGYPSFRVIPKMTSRLVAFNHVPALARAMRYGLQRVGPSRIGISAKSAGLLEFGGTYPGAYLLKRGLFMPWELDELLPRQMVRDGLEALDPIQHIAAAASTEGLDPYWRVCALEASLYMRNQLLRDTDWATMAHSIEARVPLVDPILYTKLAHLPLDRFAYKGKSLLFDAPHRPMPPYLRNRQKTGFMTPISSWIKSLPTLSERSGAQFAGEHWSRSWSVVVKQMFNPRKMVAQPSETARVSLA